jgi:hypothetical protein
MYVQSTYSLLMSATVRFLGTTDDVTTCECCGRSDLKSTVALSIDESDPVYFGVTCAAHALRRSVKEIKAGSRAADEAKALAKRKAAAEAERIRNAPWFAFLAAQGTGSDTFRQIESLGGWTKANERFRAQGGSR